MKHNVDLSLSNEQTPSRATVIQPTQKMAKTAKHKVDLSLRSHQEYRNAKTARDIYFVLHKYYGHDLLYEGWDLSS